MKIGKKAFTLIELMIVVVILGVLMSTVLPKLTGAQARSRDAGRIADLSNIAAALQVYNDDNGEFPGTTDGSGACLHSTGSVGSDLVTYLQSKQVPEDPQPTANSSLCSTNKGKYYYAPVEKNGLNKNGYLLCADMETLQKANTDAGDLSGKSKYENLDTLVGTKAYTTEDTDGANHSVYCILRP